MSRLLTLPFVAVLKRIWSSKEISIILIVLRVVLLPAVLIVLDMFVSDTNVILDQIQYMISLWKINSNMTYSNNTGIEGNNTETENAGSVLLVMVIILSTVYLWSCVSLFMSPFMSSLRTSYRTSVSLLNEEPQIVTDISNQTALFGYKYLCIRRYSYSIWPLLRWVKWRSNPTSCHTVSHLFDNSINGGILEIRW